MASSSMGTVATNTTVQPTLDQDLPVSRQVSPTSDAELSQSEPEVVSVLEATKLAGLDTPLTSSLTPGCFFPVPEMPGVLLASSSSCLSFSSLSSQFGTSISDAVPVRGTPSAIGALKLHRHATISFHPAATLF